jgi:multisubunit Na+/H+ antiporter MnhC subunit
MLRPFSIPVREAQRYGAPIPMAGVVISVVLSMATIAVLAVAFSRSLE